MGVGWGLSGLSAISRCPATQATDGVRGSVNYDFGDKFCLDGQRLILTSGSYGSAGSTYRTEIDTFAQITANSTAGNGPWSFTVKTKGGQILEFGGSDDSRIEAQGKTTVAVWALNKVSDRAKNYLTVSYYEDNANGEFYPTRISYTGNELTGSVGYSSVSFGYQARSDVAVSYQAGSMIRTSVRLTNVKTMVGKASVRDYRIGYDTSAATGRSRVKSVQECAWDAAVASWACLGATIPGWQDGQSGFSEATETRIAGWASIFSNGKYLPMDINGDGKTDLVFALPYGNDIVLKSFISNGVGFAEVTETRIYGWASMFSRGKYMPMDINGDGKTDLVFALPYENDIVLKSLVSNGVGFVEVTETRIYGWASIFDSAQYLPMDINGDGKTDLVFGLPYENDIVLKSLVSNGIGFAQVTETRIYGWASLFSRGKYMPMDINGDGKTDLVFALPYENDIVLKSLVANGVGFAEVTEARIYGWASIFDSAQYLPMDINSDGKTDLVFGLPYENDIVLKSLVSNGIGFAQVTETRIYGWASMFSRGKYMPMDISGDGKTDLVFALPYENDIVLKSLVANGVGFAEVTETRIYGWASIFDSAKYLPMDISGDGKTDLVFGLPYEKDIVLKSMISNRPFPDLLTSITPAYGPKTTLTYKPLTDATVYTKDNTAVSPYTVSDFQGPMYVVSKVETSNAVGGNFTTDYTYGGAKIDHDGRGFLGFRWMQAKDGSGMYTKTYYSQTFPNTGMPTTVEQSASGSPDRLLESVSNTVTSKKTLASNNTYYYFPYVSSSTETTYDLTTGGTGATYGMSTTTATTMVYDDYGNPGPVGSTIVVTTSDGYCSAPHSHHNFSQVPHRTI